MSFPPSSHPSSPPSIDPAFSASPYSLSLASSLRSHLLSTAPPGDEAADPSFYSLCSMGRFLVARDHDLHKSLKLAAASRAWRRKRSVPTLRGLAPSGDRTFLYGESETGKMYVAGQDASGRPIVVFDNTVQNTGNDLHQQMQLMGWTFTLAEKLMPPNISKWVVFINLSNFSIFNTPPWPTTRETVETLTQAYPERLGCCILFGAPRVFGALMKLVTPLLDEKTSRKVYMAAGDVRAGSWHDANITKLLGEGWRKTTNVDEPYRADGRSSNGFAGSRRDHYWNLAIDIERRASELQQLKEDSHEGARGGEEGEKSLAEQGGGRTSREAGGEAGALPGISLGGMGEKKEKKGMGKIKHFFTHMIKKKEKKKDATKTDASASNSIRASPPAPSSQPLVSLLPTSEARRRSSAQKSSPRSSLTLPPLIEEVGGGKQYDDSKREGKRGYNVFIFVLTVALFSAIAGKWAHGFYLERALGGGTTPSDT